ncbi:MAG: hypothetical protein JSS38_08375 [Nitrospira sp.]|nr:hypothetical protein [Nitrospira sp.]
MRISEQCFAAPIRMSDGLFMCAIALMAIVWAGGCGGVFTEIPELDTADGRVFTQRCGACHGKPFGDHGVTHGVPDARFRTMVEWQEELARMESLMREKGIPPLTAAEREAITRYLNRHAKS